jgi:G3E family GTPase
MVVGESFVATMDRLAGSLVRAKGILWLSSAPQRRTIYQRTRLSFTPGEPCATTNRDRAR